MAMEIEYTDPRDLRDEYLKCRVFGHNWDELLDAEFSPVLWRTAAGAVALRCVRCAMERYDYIGKDMLISSRRYKAPRGYSRVSRDEGSRPILRGELFRRSLLVHSYKTRANGSDRRATASVKTVPLVATRKGRARNGN